MTDLEDLLPLAVEAMDRARQIIAEREPSVVTAKGDRDMVSDIDVLVERTIRSRLSERVPHIGFLGEEEGIHREESGLLWVLDPIDGTANFVQGIPLFAVSLGLVAERRPVLGIVDIPTTNSRYTAITGQGAFCSGERLRVKSPSRVSDAIITVGDYAVGENAESRNISRLAVTRELAERALRVRMLGSAAIDLVWLAHGKTNVSINFSNKPWDTAAGVVIAQEAGAITTDRDGTPHTLSSVWTVAAPESLITQVIDILAVAESKELLQRERGAP